MEDEQSLADEQQRRPLVDLVDLNPLVFCKF